MIPLKMAKKVNENSVSLTIIGDKFTSWLKQNHSQLGTALLTQFRGCDA